MILDSFPTGSRVFGYATPESDFDIVLRCDPEDFQEPEDASINSDLAIPDDCYDPADIMGRSVRYGSVNFICCYTDEVFEAWKEGTRAAIAAAVKTREEAIAIIRPFREAIRGLEAKER